MSSTVAIGDVHRADKVGTTRHSRSALPDVVAWAEIAALVLITGALIAATIITSHRANANVSTGCVRVESGQTLWTLATQHPVQGLTTEQTAGLIASINHIDDGRIAAGTTIRIPAQTEQNVALACR